MKMNDDKPTADEMIDKKMKAEADAIVEEVVGQVFTNDGMPTPRVNVHKMWGRHELELVYSGEAEFTGKGTIEVPDEVFEKGQHYKVTVTYNFKA